MKPFSEILKMFTDWSEDELQTGLMLICKKFGLSIRSESTRLQFDFIDDSEEWDMIIGRMTRIGDAEIFVYTYVEDSALIYVTPPHYGALTSIHKADLFRFNGNKIEKISKTLAMRSLLAMMSGSDIFTDPDSGKTLICHVPEFSSLEELQLKLEMM